MNTDIKKSKKFWKRFFQIDEEFSFWKNHGKCLKKHRDIKLATTEKRRNCLMPDLNYHSTRYFTQIIMKELVYLGLSILELKENVRILKKQLTYFLWDNIWSGNICIAKVVFLRKSFIYSFIALFSKIAYYLSRLSRPFKLTSL